MQVGEKLAGFVIYQCNEQIKEIDQYLPSNKLSEGDVGRLILCLAVLNIANVTFFLYLLKPNDENTKKIYENMLDSISSLLKQSYQLPGRSIDIDSYPRVGDLILDSNEKNLINLLMGGGIVDDSRVSYHTFLPVVFSIRVGQYLDAFKEKTQEEWISDPITGLFIKHIGISVEPFSPELLQLSFYLTKSFMVTAEFVKHALAANS